MYTVVRFQSDSPDPGSLISAGQALNARRPGMFDGLDCVEGRMSCSICQDRSWDTHVSEMQLFLNDFDALITEARKRSIRIEFDVAIDAEDYSGGKTYLSFRLPSELINLLAVKTVSIMITYYLIAKT